MSRQTDADVGSAQRSQESGVMAGSWAEVDSGFRHGLMGWGGMSWVQVSESKRKFGCCGEEGADS